MIAESSRRSPFYLENGNKRREIAFNGLKVVTARHTYRHRAEFIIEKILQSRVSPQFVDRPHLKSRRMFRTFYEKQAEVKTHAQDRIYDFCLPDPDTDGRYNIRERLKEALMVAKGTVLDIGCQRGGYCYNLKKAGLDAVGIDISHGYIKMAREKDPDGVFAVADALYLPFKTESFDTVLLSEILEHIMDEKAVVAEVKRVLKNGGIVYVTVPAYLEGTEEHVRFLSKESLAKIFEDFAIEFIDNFKVQSTIMIAKKTNKKEKAMKKEEQGDSMEKRGRNSARIDVNTPFSPMNILLATNHLLGFTGSEITLFTIADFLVRKKHRVSIYSKYIDPQFTDIFKGIAPFQILLEFTQAPLSTRPTFSTTQWPLKSASIFLHCPWFSLR